MSITQKIYLMIALIGLTAASVASVAIFKMAEIGDELEEITYQDIPLMKRVTAVTLHQLEQAILLERSLRASSVKIGTNFESDVKKFEELALRVDQEILAIEEFLRKALAGSLFEQSRKEFKYILTEFEDIKKEHLIYEEHAITVLNAIENGNIADHGDLVETIEYKQEKLDKDLAALLINLEEFTERSTKHALDEEEKGVQLILIFGVIGTFIGICIGALVGRNISLGVSGITLSMTRILSGKTNLEIPGNRRTDEIGRMAEAVDIFRQNSIERDNVQKQQQETLRDLDFQKYALDEHSIVSIADIKGKIIHANEKFCEISGYTLSELVGNNHRMLKSDEHSTEFYIDLWKTIANGKTWHGDIKNFKKDGSSYWVKATIVPSLNEAGKPFQYVAIRTDITSQKENEQQLIDSQDQLQSNIGEIVAGRKRLEEEAEKQVALLEDLSNARDEAEAANKTKSTFLAAMSHEIRTPMTGIIGMVDLILDSELQPRQIEWAANIRKSADNLLIILNEILDQSKLEAGKLEITFENFNLSNLIENTAHLFLPKIEEKGLSLNINVKNILVEDIHADSLRIGQILSNFLSNALKFTKAGSINLTVEQEPKGDDCFLLCIKVEDTGIGMNDDTLGRLFKSFTQADGSTSRNYGGTGLGLSISKQLAELMEGDVGVESIEGTGSTFWFKIMCEPANGPVKNDSEYVISENWQATRPLKVLLAEDNDINQQLIMAIFEKLDHELTIAENGKVATDLVASNEYDLVLMDIRMPVMDGIEATKIIRSSDTENSDIPIIALTADISAGNIETYLNAGMDLVCGKPLGLSIVLNAINKVLGEEVHVSLDDTQSKPTDQTDKSVDTAGVKNFTEALEFIANKYEQARDADKVTRRPPALATLDEATFLKLLSGFEETTSEQSGEFSKIMSELSASPSDQVIMQKAKELSHTLKGIGGSFGYDLLTTVAHNADKILKENETFSQEHIEQLINHSKAIELILTKKISGNGGKHGQVLLDALKLSS